jgi:hypothetical protein
MTNSKNRPKSDLSIARLHRWCRRAAFTGSLLITVTAAASSGPGDQGVINKFALNAYCSEAQSEATSLSDGRLSYKGVVEMASNRALIEHPNVYRDRSAWKTRIVAMLDQYGDEPTNQLCTENPGPRS